jgi:hypothetical protein
MSISGDSIFDFADIEELDPSIADGYRIIYDREVPVEVRNQTSDGNADNGTMEALKIKMLMLGPEEVSLTARLYVCVCVCVCVCVLHDAVHYYTTPVAVASTWHPTNM